MSRAAQARELHAQHPMWTTKHIAALLGCSVRAVQKALKTSRCSINPRSIQKPDWKRETSTDMRALIDAAVAQGRVTKCPTVYAVGETFTQFGKPTNTVVG
jgi:predicted transcriptional regulator